MTTRQRVVEPYEVFQQAKDGDPMRHGGNVLAPDPELALHYARELFGRRNESTRLWVVRRADIAVLEDPDLLQPPLDRSFKKPAGYVMRDKLATARERSGAKKRSATSG
jgi:ring-1,2-phenylacetyl-CoA epoxidase subunit PaaB